SGTIPVNLYFRVTRRNKDASIGRMVSFEGIPRKKGDVYYVYMDLESAQYYNQTSAIELQIEALEGVEEELDYLELKRSVFIGV
ncbi:hypothetical protein, partial [Lysobacter hankyongensis]